MGKSKKQICVSNNNSDILPIIEVLKEIKNSEFVKASEIFYDDFNRIIERLSDRTFKLAIVGEFSSGKSTFLNALIGEDILKHGAKETTATVTELQNVFRQDNKSVMDVYHVNGKIEKDVQASEITDYTSTSSQKYAVAQEIEKVVIKSNILKRDLPVCFVDTPGLNGVADNHREKTIEQIKNAHACIYLMQVRGLGQSDIDFLKYISKYQHNIIFVQNFIDELKKLEGETPKEKIQEQKRIIEEKVIDADRKIEYQIVAVSARKALISKSHEFDTYNGEALTEELRDRLYDESAFESVYDVINDLMEKNERNKIQQRDAVLVSLNLLEQLRSIVTFENDKEKKEWDNSIEGVNKRNYEKLIELLNENKEAYEKKLKNYVEAESMDIRKECNQNILTGMDNIQGILKNNLNSITKVEELEKYIIETMPGRLYSLISDIEDDSNSQLQIKFDNLISNAVLRIKQYTGSSTNIKIEEIDMHTKYAKSEYKNFVKEEGEIENLRGALSEKKAKDAKIRKDMVYKKMELESIENKIRDTQNSISRNSDSKQLEVSRLGKMPEKEKRTRKETYYVDRGGFGIMDFLLGPKEKTRYVDYYDDSKQREWKKKKEDIENKYHEKENNLNNQSRILADKKRQYSEDISRITRGEVSRKNEISNMERLLETKIEYIEVQKKKAKLEYLDKIRASAMDSVNEYLDNIKLIFQENFENAVSENKTQASRIINSLFNVSYDERINYLKTLICETEGAKGYEQTETLIQIIDKTRKKMEEYLCQQ